MRKKGNLFIFLIFIFVMFIPCCVKAENIVDYSLTITNDYKFKEVIKYTLTNYEMSTNGYNYFYDIVNNDVYADVLYNNKYKKSKKLVNGKYYVTLSYTYSEYSFSNSRFLNTCFINNDYSYGIDGYSLKAVDGFNCMKADKLTITLITNHPVSSSNAKVSGNKYIWNPSDANFVMNIDIDKEHKSSSSNTSSGEPMDSLSKEDFDKEYDNNTDDSTQNDDSIENDEFVNDSDENGGLSGTILIVIISCLLVIALIVILFLNEKKKNLEQI